MTVFSTYRTAATFVAAIFFVFNVGLPVVIASCPMTETPFAVCGMCKPASHEPVHNLTTVTGASCCVIVFASDKNSTEFIQTKSQLTESFKAVAFLPVPINTHDFSQYASTVQLEDSLAPKVIDIPIFTSSLLM